ncbi:EAL domain-containing response regulator [Spirochaeta africana]|uniref:Diguanylate cyclase (GGDEF) domain-containing protein n=1 Tax=Spirochaeta africana (strain ATCC 700263 / DSM 8902 / Z-7692) TaxID=889378 RepID=H9UIR0_SPIAZ|nr:EAL domain-containing protein [Spirochaeta africana]AFG37403.1 diguanylate cyclase (GGDEF) domain-containing protein [Spirochaeta africana DSM 8902]
MGQHESASVSDEQIVFQPEAPAAAADTSLSWTILVVDDDPQVHTVTLLALSKLTVHGRKLRFLHAYSAQEAYSCMQQEPEVAVVLLDVVMEQEDAGLHFVRRIRDDLQNHAVRIILRTGQPGYAPELKAIQDFDINDYKTKAELTRTRLITSVTTAVRSYDQIRSVLQQQRGMEEIVHASSRLLSHHSMQPFAEEVLRQISTVLHQQIHGLICFSADDSPAENPVVLTGSGRFTDSSRQPLDTLDPDPAAAYVRSTIRDQKSRFEDTRIGIHLEEQGHRFTIFLGLTDKLETNQRKLLDVLLTNVSVGFRNIGLFQRLEQHAYYDELTGLLSANKITAQIDSHLSQADRGMLVIAIDVDNFSEINDALGYEYGDQLLCTIAERLQTHFIGSFSVARLAGDTFCIFGPEQDLQPQLVFSVLDEPFDLYDTTSTIPFTLGIVRIDDFTGRGTDAVNRAILAMKQAKRSARSRFLYFTRTMQEAIQHRVNISRSLKPALLKNEFQLHYQPQISALDNSIAGVEALIRWRRPSGELVSPQEFIPTAESTGLINEIGRWVVREAVHKAREWSETFQRGIRVGINVSMKQFYSTSFLPFMSHILRESSVDPGLIELEITESLVMQDTERVIASMVNLKELGVRIAIDDFGTGFSSLNYLLRMPLDRLKIDRSFISNLETNVRSKSLTQFLIQLGRQLNLEVIAEGIETVGQLQITKELGCQEFQGFLYSTPLPEDDLHQLFRNWPEVLASKSSKWNYSENS